MSNLDGSPSYISYGLEDQIIDNLISFLKWGLLEVGSYYNIKVSGVDSFGHDQSILSPLIAQGVPNYTVYKSTSRNEWVWESNILHKSTGISQPIQISGVYVNGTFYPTGTNIAGTSYIVDYSRGQVIFSNPLPSGHTVRCPRTQRYVNVYSQDSYEYRSLVTEITNNYTGSGVTTNNESKVYLPAIFVNLDGYETLRGVGLGSRSKVCLAHIEFDIFTANDWDRKKLQDFCYFLETKHVPCYDLARAPSPLDYRGALVSGTMTWPILISGYPTTNPGWFRENARVIKYPKSTQPIKHSRVSIGLEIDAHPI